jgi:hypothetical protein
MKAFLKILVVATIFFSNLSYSQSTTDKKSLNTGTIQNQFDYVISKSTNYKNFEMVKQNWMYSLKKHVLDSLKKEKETIVSLNQTIASQNDKFKALQTELEEVKNNLAQETKSKDSIDLFGIQFNKSSFKTIIGVIIAFLLIALSYFVYLYINANKTTQKALADYNELEDEYSTARTRALEREQVLNRKLQDELNKQKG